MGELPVVSGKEAVRRFEKLGWVVDHQSGSHMILYKEGAATLSVPNHKELATGLLRALIRKAGIPVDEFIALK